MDTTIASPKFSSSKTSSRIPARASGVLGFGLSLALSVSVGVWLVALTTGAADAQTPRADSARVTYADLDISTDVGARTLLQRINVAAGSACGEEAHSPLLPREGAHHRVCVANAVDAAVRRIDSPMLTALNNETQSAASVSLAAR